MSHTKAPVHSVNGSTRSITLYRIRHPLRSRWFPRRAKHTRRAVRRVRKSDGVMARR